MKTFYLLLINMIPENYDVYLLPTEEVTPEQLQKLEDSHQFCVNGDTWQEVPGQAMLYVNAMRHEEIEYQNGTGGGWAKHKFLDSNVPGVITRVFSTSMFL